MIFTVVYRDKAGQRATLELDVPDRSAVWTELKKRGISALSVREGTDKAHKPSSKRPALVRGILAGVCVVALALGAWWWMSAREDTRPPAERPKAEKPAKPDAGKPAASRPPAGKGERPARPAATATNAPAAKPEDKKVDPNERLDLVAITNKSGEVMERWRTPDGKTHARLTPPPPVFDNVIDQTLSIALSVPPGHSLPPMPSLGPDSTKAFAEALKKPIVIKDDDPENVKKAKLLVQSGREAIFEALKSGKSVQEIIADHCAAVNNNAELHNAVGAEYRKLVAEGDLEAAEEYRRKANEVLQQSGADPVPQHGTNARRPSNQKGQGKQ